MSAPLNILLTGVSGYIGGSVFAYLHQHLPSTTTFTLIVRPSPTNEAAIAHLRSLPNVSVHLGSHSDSALLTPLVHAASTIIHTADSADDLPSARAFTSALSTHPHSPTSTPPLYIHTSGTGILTYGPSDARGAYSTPDSDTWSDLQFERYTSIPPTAPHRNVDTVVIDAARAHPSAFRLVLISPPTIYGVGSGPVNRLSQQIPTVVRLTLHTGHVGTVGKGLNRWQSVHVDDLADLYYRVVLAYHSPSPPPSVAQGGGLYFAAAGEFMWGDVQRAVGAELAKRGLVRDEYREWTAEEAERYGGGASVWMAIGSNSRCRSERAQQEGLGWQPKHVDAVLTTIPSDVDEVLTREAKRGKK